MLEIESRPYLLQQRVLANLARDILDGKEIEHDFGTIAKVNFMKTVRLLDLEDGREFERYVMNGKIKVFVPRVVIPEYIEPIAAPIQIKDGMLDIPVAILGPSTWANQEYFMEGGLVRSDARFFRSTRLTVDNLLQVVQHVKSA